MLNIVIPMAGRGSRFSNAGFTTPKPFIDINGKYMIEVVINNLIPNCEHQFIFICQDSHIREYELMDVFAKACDNFIIVGIDEVTEGAALSVLKARKYIDSDMPLMIANSDQWIDIDINDYLIDIETRELDGSMLTMFANAPKWSYVLVNDAGLVRNVMEKVVISNEATVGVYNFFKGKDFCHYVDKMVTDGLKSNGEYYVAPVYTLMAKDSSKNIGVYNVGSENRGMYGLGTPDDLANFLTFEVSKIATCF